MTHPNSPWTDEKVEQLKVLYAEGMTNAAIAKQIGFKTRNMIIGKVSRLGLKRNVTNVRQKSGKVTREVKREVKRRDRQMSLEQLPAKMARLSTNGNWGGPSMVDLPELPASAEAQDAAPSKHLKCIELEPGQCKYPSARSPFTFCGHPATGSYCAPHARLCGRAEMKRKERWQTHVYLTEDKFLELKRIAEQESRSTTGQIEYFLNRSIEAYANEKGVAKC